MNQVSTAISLFSSAKAVEPECQITLEEFIRDIQSGRWKDQINRIRQFISDNKRKQYDDAKRHLPAVTLSAACISRAHDLSPEAKSIIHSGWLQADFDLKDNGHLADKEALTGIREKLLGDPYVGAVFCGPSGEGIKAVVCIDGERHKESWFAAERYFFENYGLKLDKATKDPLRLCFVSYDPLAEIYEDVPPLPIPESQKPQEEKWYPPVETTAVDIREMLKLIPTRPDYDEWLRIASAVWSVLPMGEGCKLLHEWSPEEKEGEYATKHKHRLKQIGIGTLVHIASQHGFDAKAAYRRKRWAGRIRFAEETCESHEGENLSADTAPKGIVSEWNILRERVIDALRDGQIGDAGLWVALRRGLRVWNIHTRTWMVYEDGIWKRDEGNTTLTDISSTLCRIYDAVIESVQVEIIEKPAPEEQNENAPAKRVKKEDIRVKELKDLNARRKSLGSNYYLKGVEELAKSMLHLPASAFDAHPDLLVVENGTLNFAEGRLREHRSTDYLTHKTSIIFDPDAKCPIWDEYLEYLVLRY